MKEMTDKAFQAALLKPPNVWGKMTARGLKPGKGERITDIYRYLQITDNFKVITISQRKLLVSLHLVAPMTKSKKK